jgi:uncharacterized protein (DUF1800 family)
MLRKITRDPAMLLYLDNYQNIAGRAQENYAREVMELFSMGVGNYSEQDVREVARAFTGETVDSSCSSDWSMAYQFLSARHDNASKTVFGQTFNLGSGDTNHVLDLIATRISGAAITPYHATYPAMTIYMAWKILTWFLLETIDMSDPATGELADYFYHNFAAGDVYNIRETLRKLFKSQLFYAPAYRWNMYKNGADFIVGALRQLGLSETSYSSAVFAALSLMGMPLFAPPNVAGWPQGAAWINSSSLIARFNYADRLSLSSITSDFYADSLKSNGIVANNNDHAAMIEFFRGRLIQQPLTSGESAALGAFLSGVGNSLTSDSQYRRKIRGLVHLFMTMPKYQLK